MDKNKYISQVNASGFPFQIRVEDEIRSTFEEHRWRAWDEHKWKNRETKEEGFIDLVVEKVINQSLVYYLVIECKRMKEGSCVFINKPDDKEKCNAVLLDFRLGHQANNIRPVWEKCFPYPESYISSYCAVPGQSDKDTPMLERICDSLLNSVESIAGELYDKMQLSNSVSTPIKRLFIPAVVINTELQSCIINPEKISLSLGTIEKEQGKISSVPYIRFQKSFGTRFDSLESSYNLREINKANQRTIFVIHAQSLKEFLGSWEIF